MRNSKKIMSSLLITTVLISSVCMGFADKTQHSAQNVDDNIVQDEYGPSKSGNDYAISNNSFKDTLFKYQKDLVKSPEDIKECREALVQIRKSIEGKYSKEELENIKNISIELKNKYKDMTVLSFEDVIVKDRNLKFDTPPVIKNERTLIPIRAITEGFGADVKWNEETGEVTITKDGNRVIVKTGSKSAIVNGREISLDVNADIYNDRTYVPLRFIAENLGIDVDWDNDLRIIKVSEKKKSVKNYSYNVM